ncbi:hypothetical protein CN930_12830 [Bacillus cereus]|nr:hypothetical protein CON40_26620 [Bacillus cereus]PGL38882.1 hypothetical protein CN930_12830 [Bacillus cereus]
MGKHKKQKGIDLISNLVDLGKVLGYRVEEEYPIKENGINNTRESIDVVWLAVDSQITYEFPLFVFEVESKSRANAAQNTQKIFAKDSSVFKKPKFFFHLFIESTKDDSIINNSMNLYRHLNYKIYEIERCKDTTQFIMDVLEQQKSLGKSLNIKRFILTLIESDFWNDLLDINKILNYIEKIYSEEQQLLLSYASLSGGGYSSYFLKRFVNFLQGMDLTNNEVRVESVLPQDIWTKLIYIGIAYFHTEDEDKRKTYELYVKNVFNDMKIDDMKSPLHSWKINPIYLEVFGAVLAILSSLMKDNGTIQKCILKKTIELMQFLDEEDITVTYYTVLWSLHIAGASGLIDEYNELRCYLNKKGGVGECWVNRPPLMIENVYFKTESDYSIGGMIEFPGFVELEEIFRCDTFQMREFLEWVIKFLLESNKMQDDSLVLTKGIWCRKLIIYKFENNN